MVKAIEADFVPVYFANNKAGLDAKMLERFKEPAWNYQVVRFLDHSAKDILPRKDKVWTTTALATRMAETLRKRKRTPSEALKSLLSSVR